MDNWIRFFWPMFENTKKESMEYYGVLGDYFGGFIGTLLAVISIYFIYRSWRLTQNTQRRTSTFQMVSKMIDSHEEIVASTTVRKSSGREAILHMLSEFYKIYGFVTEYETAGSLSVWDKVDIAYTYMYYGTQTVVLPELSRFDSGLIKRIADRISQERQKGKPKKGTFKGHQNRLSHYFRNIYGAYEFIDKAPIPRKEKYSLAKLYRTKLSNYEQALLCLNIMSHLGRPWIDSGLLRRYQPIKNLPEGFFTFEKQLPFKLKDLFPMIEFEWEVSQKPATTTKSFQLGRRTIVIIKRDKLLKMRAGS